jgi:NADH-ubiquinone oxidoreductase chain 4
VDVIGWGLVALRIWLTLLIILASPSYTQGVHGGSYAGLIILLLLILTLRFSASDYLVFYIFFEASLVPILLMLIGWGYQPERVKAGYYMLFYTLTASMPLLVMLVGIALNGASRMVLSAIRAVGWFSRVALISAFLLKLPMFIFHLWLPKAHVEAPVAGSIVLAGVLLKLGGYGLIRVFGLVDPLLLAPGMVSIGLLGGLITGLVCLGQIDVKSLVAYSSVGHMGIALAGVFRITVAGVGGAYTILIGHGLCSSGLFCTVNYFYERSLSRRVLLLKGLMTIAPSLIFFWFMLCVRNMACPPTINLLREILLMGGLLRWSIGAIGGLSMLAFIGAAYSLFLYRFTSHGEGPDKVARSGLSGREYLLATGHLVPLVTLILRGDLFIG